MILHLTHTDIRSDNRILKEVICLIDIYKTVYSFGVANKNQSHSLKSNIKNSHNINILTKNLSFLPRPILYFLNLIEINFRFFFKGLKIKPKIIHCHDTMVLPSGYFLKLLLKCNLIYDAHELESDKNNQSILLSRATLFIEKMFWSKVDLLISVSDSIIQWYNENIGKKDSLLILNSPVIENDSYEYDKKYLRSKFKIAEESKIFLYVGEFAKGRSINSLLEIFSSGNINSHIIFIGFGELKKDIMKHELNYKNIHFHESVKHFKLVNLIKSVDYGLCLIENISQSDYFCLPNKLFEYAFSGIPVLASDFPDMKKIVKEYNLGITVNVEDKNSILQSIKRLETKNFCYNFQYLNKLSWQEQEKKLIKYYNKILMI